MNHRYCRVCVKHLCWTVVFGYGTLVAAGTQAAEETLVHQLMENRAWSFFLTLTLMLQDSGPFSHRTMFRFSKLKLIGLGGLGMVPIRSLLWQFKQGILGRTLKVVLPSACPVFSWRSLPMVLLPHCLGSCSRGSPLCLFLLLRSISRV